MPEVLGRKASVPSQENSMTYARPGHSVAKPQAAIVGTALKKLSPHAGATAPTKATIDDGAKKAATIGKATGDGHASAKDDGATSDGHHGTLRVQHHTTQRRLVDGSDGYKRRARDD